MAAAAAVDQGDANMAGNDANTPGVAPAGELQQAYPHFASIEMMTFMHGMQQLMQLFMQSLQQQFAVQQLVPGHHAGAISHPRLEKNVSVVLTSFRIKNMIGRSGDCIS